MHICTMGSKLHNVKEILKIIGWNEAWAEPMLLIAIANEWEVLPRYVPD